MTIAWNASARLQQPICQKLSGEFCGRRFPRRLLGNQNCEIVQQKVNLPYVFKVGAARRASNMRDVGLPMKKRPVTFSRHFGSNANLAEGFCQI
jgi:hypothetical protein